MLPPVERAEKGFTLIEFLFALVILMIGLLGLLEAVNFGIRQNMGNKLRNDAVMLADQEMAKQRILAFDKIATTNTSQPANTGAVLVFYSISTISIDINPPNPTSKSVAVKVRWTERNIRKLHTLSTVITNEFAN